MQILHATAEIHPYSKTGGLADMVGALTKSLAEANHTVGVVTPLYPSIRTNQSDLQLLDYEMVLPLGPEQLSARIWTLEPSQNLTIYFVENEELYDRKTFYFEADNARRFIFLSKAVAHLARYHPARFEVIHVHDWQVALVPLLVKHQSQFDGWSPRPATCLTIHNLAYQGLFAAADFSYLNLPWHYFSPAGVEFYQQLNCLKGGIVYADLITTVSPRYAREITTEAFGCDLEDLLKQRHDSLVGILNGVDYSEWNTVNNPYIPEPYTAEAMEGKAKAKAALQAEFHLPVVPDIPLFGTVTRLADQKGPDIQLAALEEMLASKMQFVLLGSGEPLYENGFRRLAKRYPNKVGVRLGYDHGLAHRIEAGCDFFIMPSRYEPCGLNQMYSLRYGTIPIVRVTGGLDDSTVDAKENLQAANGIKFSDYSSRALSKAIRKALALYDAKELMDQYRRNGMEMDFSWEETRRSYEAVYEEAKRRAN